MDDVDIGPSVVSDGDWELARILAFYQDSGLWGLCIWQAAKLL